MTLLFEDVSSRVSENRYNTSENFGITNCSIWYMKKSVHKGCGYKQGSVLNLKLEYVIDLQLSQISK